jgi:hypothetical protein
MPAVKSRNDWACKKEEFVGELNSVKMAVSVIQFER